MFTTCGFALIFSLPLAAKEKINPPSQSFAGNFSLSGQGARLSLEKGRSLQIKGSQALFQDHLGHSISQVDFNQKLPKNKVKISSSLEESDLGSQGSKAQYLHGKKEPRGRELSANSLKESQEAPIKSQSWQAQGVSIQQSLKANQSQTWDFDWGITQESFQLDSRKGLVEVEQVQKQGPFLYSLKQWSDGSFERRLKSPQGQVRYLYDALDQNYRVLFLNAKEQKIQEWFCEEQCELES
ncbi:MAG: hypothetical protein KDK66_01975 [Deltaproteobacteria bacterium]|nr:hypothetical protein [Deltaproteobacteria bacterium]